MKENKNKIIDKNMISPDLKGALNLDSFYDNQNKVKKKSIIIILISSIVIISLIIFSVMIIFNSFKNLRKESDFKNITEPKIIEMEEKKENLILNVSNVNLDRAYAKTEIIWIDKNNNQLDKPLKPILKNLKPVKYDKENYKFISVSNIDPEWYDYNNKIWANAVDDNNNYFVWIPRFAYKIVYYEDSSYSKVSGYSDARGILKVSDNDKNTFLKIADPNKGIISVGNHYILHPSFMNDKNNEYINGGNDAELSGFWCAKYESAFETSQIQLIAGSTDILINDNIKLVIKPAKRVWRNISIKNSYINAFNYDRKMDSHLMKASEWGAVVYLSFSKYGTDGNNVGINDNDNFISGGIDNEEDVYKIKYVQSSNRNPTGIYDLSGGISEYISSYISNGSLNIYINGGNGLNDIGGDAHNSKYRTIYNSSATDIGDNSIENSNNIINNYYANLNRRGDAIWETSNFGAINSGWFFNSSVFPIGRHPYFIRGGSVRDGIRSGLFSYNNSDGGANEFTGFRVVLNVNN